MIYRNPLEITGFIIVLFFAARLSQRIPIKISTNVGDPLRRVSICDKRAIFVRQSQFYRHDLSESVRKKPVLLLSYFCRMVVATDSDKNFDECRRPLKGADF